MPKTTPEREPAQILAAHVLHLAETTARHDRIETMDDLVERGYPGLFILTAFRATDKERHEIENRHLLVNRTVQEGERLKAMPYEEYRRTEHWAKVQAAALAFYGRRCQLNESHDGKLNVHHRSYGRLGSERISDVQVLCRRCHAKHHNVPEGA